ncbi:MAG: hypothetical protein MUC35_01775 [Candidatus Margulisbacteria bacterium]|nr:hypothetical protein [Candidatus Margulisiibacteriota bacterium]
MKPLITLFLSLVAATVVFAHAPSDIKAAYDQKNQFLTITVAHQVGDPKSHYVNAVEVKLNGRQVLAQRFDHQYGDKQQLVIAFWPNLKSGTELEIKADCSRFGAKNVRIKL